MHEIKLIPKVHLHLHLDGSISKKVVSKLSGLQEEEVEKLMIAPNKCQSLKEYLGYFDLPINLMQTKENLIEISKNLIEDLKKDNVIYAEIRFAPMFHTKNGLTYEEIIEAVLEGLQNNEIKTNLILCLMRGASWYDNMKTIKMAYKYLNKGVCAIDLAGDEKKYSLDNYQEFFHLAQKLNIPYTIHAGEVEINEIDKAIKLNTKRIGHGITSINNQDILNKIKNNNILLEICPTSNIQTNIIDNYQNHPIKKIYNQDVNISINTDNSSISNVSLNEEYFKLKQTFNFTKDDFIKININSINYSFLTKEEKEKLCKKILLSE